MKKSNNGFFYSLRCRFSKTRGKRRFNVQPPNDSNEFESTDYAADYSSENSSSVTPNQTPKHNFTVPHSNPDEMNVHTKVGDEISLGIKQLSSAEEERKQRERILRQYTYFELRIHLRAGENLIARDKNGSSDPYVKIKQGNQLLCKSRTIHRSLNPEWNDTFILHIKDPFTFIEFKVFDYDWGLQDDFMGSAKLDLTTMDLGKPNDFEMRLSDQSKLHQDFGQLKVTVTLQPCTQDDLDMHHQQVQKLLESCKKLKLQVWSAIVTIVLVEGKNMNLETNGVAIFEPYIKFRLANEKYKSKTSYKARWLEQFDFHLFDEDQILHVSLWSRSLLIGQCAIDLSELDREKTHGIWQKFDDHQGELFLMLTISGTTSSETVSDLNSYKENKREIQATTERYKLFKTFEKIRDVGHLTVKVFSATGLAAADIGGKSDPFCVLELDNSRLQTQTEYKTLNPSWNKIFTFNVKDITSVLDITVYDEDRDHKVEFLGKVAIPLLKICSGVKRWYPLRSKEHYNIAKGNNPQILLELYIIWNPIRAAIRIFTPKEEKLVQQEMKFKRQVFLRNVNRLKVVITELIHVIRYINGCFEWENPLRSIAALTIWLVCSIWGGLEILPVAIILIILKNWLVQCITGNSYSSLDKDSIEISDGEDDDNIDYDQKKTIKEKLQAIQEVSQAVQNYIGYLASLGESVKNALNFIVPEITWLLAIFLSACAILLKLIPIRALLVIWGLWKFSKRLLRPNAIPSNEILDFLCRVPDDNHVVIYRELRPSAILETTKKDHRKKMKHT